MRASDLRPACQFARKFGVKALVHGAAGTGKTPIADSAPRPVLLAMEPGLNSMKKSNMPTWEASTVPRIDEFFKWLFESSESRNFDTVCMDSGSEMASIYLAEAESRMKDGRAAYGEMADRLMGFNDGKTRYGHLRRLFLTPQKHTYLICKQSFIEIGGVGAQTNKAVPSFPGKVLNVEVPHMYDLIMHLGQKNVPSVGTVMAFQTKGSYDVLARDRSDQLAEFEFPDLSTIFKKCMA